MMTANQKIALALLIGRVIVLFLLSKVARKQWIALRSQEYPELRRLRIALLVGTVIIIAGNIMPVVIDVLGVFGKGSFGLLLAYVFSNNITAILTAYVMLYNLKLSEETEIVLREQQVERTDKAAATQLRKTNKIEKELTDENTDLRKDVARQTRRSKNR